MLSLHTQLYFVAHDQCPYNTEGNRYHFSIVPSCSEWQSVVEEAEDSSAGYCILKDCCEVLELKDVDFWSHKDPLNKFEELNEVELVFLIRHTFAIDKLMFHMFILIYFSKQQ